jgi:DNA-binding beta-propeller fold protein YncE
MGPVGQEEAKPTKAVAPVNSVVDPGIIPSRQGITPAGLQSVFESRVNGVVFSEDGRSVYAATLGQNSSHVFQIDLETNHMVDVIDSPVGVGMQGLAYDPGSHSPMMSGLS